MARTPNPWYRAERDEWRVILRGVDHLLGNHPPNYPAPRKQRKRWNVPQPILDRFHELMAAKPAAPLPPREKTVVTVAVVFEKFLEWCKLNRAERTYEWSRTHIQSFCDHLKARDEPIRVAVFPAAEVAPFHVTEWVDSKRKPDPGKRAWGANHRRGAITAVVRAFSWATKSRLIPENPVRGIEKPAQVRREQVLTREEFDTLLSLVHDDPFRDVLEFCWETGCRVQELRLLEARHYRPESVRFELPPREAKGKKRWRLIYLTERAEEIVRPLLACFPEGPVFRNEDGNPWDAQNFNNRFCRLQKRLGRDSLGGIDLDPHQVKALARTLPRMKTEKGHVLPKTEKELLREARKKLSSRAAAKAGTKYTLTSIRHSFATRLLESGCDHVTVSALLGHVDATMLARVYSHVGERTDFLRVELLKASGARKPAA